MNIKETPKEFKESKTIVRIEANMGFVDERPRPIVLFETYFSHNGIKALANISNVNPYEIMGIMKNALDEAQYKIAKALSEKGDGVDVFTLEECEEDEESIPQKGETN